MDSRDHRKSRVPSSSLSSQRSAPGTRQEGVISDRSFSRLTDPQNVPDQCGVSLRDDSSIGRWMDFKGEHAPQSDSSVGRWMDFRRHELEMEQQSQKPDSGQQQPAQLDSVFKLLEEDIFIFVQRELKKLQKILETDNQECLEPAVDEDEEQSSNFEAFLKITLSFLRRRKQKDLAARLWNRTSSEHLRRKLKSELLQKYQCVFEGVTRAGNPALLQQIYTELYITEGGASEVNQEHEVRHMETASRKADRAETAITCAHMFKGPFPIRTVLTKGVAGIGKTLLTHKFSLDWAEGKANQDIQLLFPFTFRALNVLKDRSFSLVQLVNHFFRGTENLSSFEDLQVIFIFDGLDECRLPLDFTKTKALTEATESASVEELLVNLIRGDLLPSAQLWITTRPAAANQIPAECISMVTEVRGFTDPQKEQYFRNRFRDEAHTVISYIKMSRSLYIMCYLPIFCWILSIVLEYLLKTKERGELPHTLTQMYIHFLVVQAKVKNIKYEGGSESDPHWTPETKRMVQSLGKLAFEQLQKGNLIFYESDLSECGLNAGAAAVYSGVFTQVFREEPGLYQDKVYCFIHLSVQEFMAALHVHQTFVNTGINLLSTKPQKFSLLKPKLKHLHQTAVDAALQSQDGHLDLFLRFLLGLSLPTNQRILNDLLIQTGSSSKTCQETAEYIKQKLSEDVSIERSINLLHCLNELNDGSLVEQIQQHLRSGCLSKCEMSPAQWSALAFILLSSEEALDQFELKKFSASEEALLRLLPVVKASNRALLNSCNLSERSFEALSSILSSSSLRVLDLSNNDLKDSGLTMLCVGLKSPHCHLEQLRLSGCLISEKGCSSLASALRSNPSSLRDLDLSYNHPGDRGLQLLSALQEDPHCSLHTLRLEPAGAKWLTPGLRKYFCELFLDPNTAHKRLKLSDKNKTASFVHMHQDQQDTFEHSTRLLCSAALTSRCYWEVQWSGRVDISVSYRGIQGKHDDVDGGCNIQSWSLSCSEGSFYIRSNDKRTHLPYCSPTSFGTVAVYMDCVAGSLSFYTVSSDQLTHLHTFKTTHTHSLFPGFRLWSEGSSVSLCVQSKGLT